MIAVQTLFKRIDFRRDGLILFVIGLGFIVDLALYSALTRLAGVGEAEGIAIALLLAAAFNFVLLDCWLNRRKGTFPKIRWRRLGLYMISILAIYLVRVLVLALGSSWVAFPEQAYIVAMGVSFCANCILLKFLLRRRPEFRNERFDYD